MSEPVLWAGPSEYPPVGCVAVMRSGDRIEIWPCESDDPACFTGCLISPGSSFAHAAVHDASCMWLREAIARVEQHD
jgi:hypothetical protein